MFPYVIQADVTATLAVEDRTEVRGREVRAVGGSGALSEQVVDVETDPAVHFVAQSKRTAFAFHYTPRLVITNLVGSQAPVLWPGRDPMPGDYRKFDHIQQAVISLEGQATPRTRLAALVMGAYGDASTATMTTQQPWNAEGPPPTPRALPLIPKLRLQSVASFATFAAVHSLSRTVTFMPSLNMLVYGGPTPSSREFLPLLLNPWLDVTVRAVTSPRDEWEVGVQPQVSRTVTAAVVDGAVVDSAFPLLYQMGGSARYRHRFDANTRVEVAAGGAAFASTLTAAQAKESGKDVGTNVQALPYAEALFATGWKYSESKHGEVYVVTRIAPWLNTFVGEAYARSESILGLRMQQGTRGIRTSAAVLYALAPMEQTHNEFQLPAYRRSFFQVYGEFAFEQKLDRTWTVDVGARVSLQEAAALNPYSPSRILQPGAFLGVRWAPLPTKL